MSMTKEQLIIARDLLIEEEKLNDKNLVILRRKAKDLEYSIDRFQRDIDNYEIERETCGLGF